MLLNEFFKTFYISISYIKEKFENFYKNSTLYEKKISRTLEVEFNYKPSPYLLSSLINYQNKKYKIDDLNFNKIWVNKKESKEFKKLNNFFWFFSLDLKSSKKMTQKVILDWVTRNNRYRKESWEFDTTAKRIISWLSNHHLSYNKSNSEYRSIFDYMIQKQTNHLIIEIKKSKNLDDKIVGCSAIILVGLCYKIDKRYLSFGLNLLKKIIRNLLDNEGFIKSRNIKQQIFYLKYLILIKEWFRESQVETPELVEETIYYFGKAYAYFWQNTQVNFLFNGNNITNNKTFDNYLKRLGYKFKSDNKDFGGYTILQNKKICIAMDTGSSPDVKYSKDYQSGALSFEIISNGKKLIGNCGYYKKKDQKLNKLSKSSATHSTLIIDDNSSCKFLKERDRWVLKTGLRVTQKKIIFEKDYWRITAAHDGYLKDYKSIHERNIEFYPEKMIFVGNDKIIKRKTKNNYKFEIRFHLEPNIKLMKTQDKKSILIELDEEGWKFTCDNYDINIDNGLYFGNKHLYVENKNIFVSGISNKSEENIKWEIKKI
tara:strand:- start:8099 stop:9724 length:1626 start_codon:yes stop_codon:yes gene_type:complete